MDEQHLDFSVQTLGTCKIPSPMTRVKFINEEQHVLFHPNLNTIRSYLDKGLEPPSFEIAGPRPKIYFDPSKIRAGIVTCGGLCPGINDVIRAIVYSLYHHYGVRSIVGFRYGYEGLTYRFGHAPMDLNPEEVEDIHDKGGTILSSSRGPQDPEEMVDTLLQMNISILFTIGGDGTLRGARDIADEVAKRNLKISVIGIPKTIDNDISYVQQSFGFETAISQAKSAIYAAHIEAKGVRNGIGLLKLMGRHSGFIAANASLASSDVNFCLIPEVKFTMEGFLDALEKRVVARKHAVVVVGEGAGQDLMNTAEDYDASGNLKLGDIGLFLKDKIKAHFKKAGIEANLKYIDPSYLIRSMPANPHDSVLCLMLGHNAVHAGMAGRTNMVVGMWNREFTHLPIPAAVSRRKQINPDDSLWNSVLASTGQPGVL